MTWNRLALLRHFAIKSVARDRLDSKSLKSHLSSRLRFFYIVSRVFFILHHFPLYNTNPFDHKFLLQHSKVSLLSSFHIASIQSLKILRSLKIENGRKERERKKIIFLFHLLLAKQHCLSTLWYYVQSSIANILTTIQDRRVFIFPIYSRSNTILFSFLK